MNEVTPALIVTGQPGGPDNSLPRPERPVDPGYGVSLPPVVDNGLPDRPAIWPPQRPNYPVDPDYDIPTPPHVWPNPPRPPGVDNALPFPPLRPSLPIYVPPSIWPSPPPGAIWPPVPPGAATDTLIALCWIVGIGYRWVVIDPGASIWPGLPVAEPK